MNCFSPARRITAALLLPFVLLAAACDGEVPTAVPTRTLSGPTIEPTDVFRPEIATLEPFNPGMSDPTAMALPRGAELPPLIIDQGSGVQAVQLTAGDGTQLNGDYYPPPGAERAPGILLAAPNRGAWGDFPLRLNSRGYGVLSMELRNAAPLGDMITMIAGTSEAAGVDPGRIGVIAAEVGADLALVACAGDLLCDALALVTPLDDRGVNFLSSYLPRPLFLASAIDDPAITIARALIGSAPNGMTYIEIPGGGRGAGLVVADSSLADALIAFIAGSLG